MLTTLLLIITLHATDTIPAYWQIKPSDTTLKEISRITAPTAIQGLYERSIGSINRMSWNTPRNRWDITKCFPCSPVDSTGEQCSFYNFKVGNNNWATVCDSSRIIIHGDTALLVRELIKWIEVSQKKEMERIDPVLQVTYYLKGELIQTAGGTNGYSISGKGILDGPFKVDGRFIKTDSILIRIK